MRRTSLTLVALAVALTAAVHASAKFKSTWMAPDAGPFQFTGKKVAAVVITDDLALQMSAEEALARELTARKVNGVASYRMIPKEELRDRDKAKAWFERTKVEGVVVMRVVSSEKETVYTPTVWSTAYYSSFWGYYGTSWTAVRSYKVSQDRIITIETLIFDLAKDKLIWAGVSETTNPKDVQSVVKDLVAETSVEMRKTGLLPGGKGN